MEVCAEVEWGGTGALWPSAEQWTHPPLTCQCEVPGAAAGNLCSSHGNSDVFPPHYGTTVSLESLGRVGTWGKWKLPESCAVWRDH